MSSLVDNNMHEVLLHNDQLRWNMSQSLVLQNFTGNSKFCIDSVRSTHFYYLYLTMCKFIIYSLFFHA